MYMVGHKDKRHDPNLRLGSRLQSNVIHPDNKVFFLHEPQFIFQMHRGNQIKLSHSLKIFELFFQLYVV